MRYSVLLLTLLLSGLAVAAGPSDRPPGLTLHDATEATRIGIALRTSLVERRAVEL